MLARFYGSTVRLDTAHPLIGPRAAEGSLRGRCGEAVHDEGIDVARLKAVVFRRKV
jgi:hypothetical protein